MSFTFFGYLAILWTVIPSFEFGWHISTLNVIQAVLTCNDQGSGSPGGYLNSKLNPCISMTDSTFSVVTSSYTVGGLVGSLSASYLVDRWGRKGSLSVSTALFAIGSGIMASTNTVTNFLIGRLLCGLGAGIGICVVPIMLAELAPPHIRGSVGTLNQVGIVFGILATQAMGLNFAEPSEWRTVLTVSAIIALVHMLLGWVMVESPLWLKNKGRPDQALRAGARVWRDGMPDQRAPGGVSDPLLDDERDGTAAANEEEGLGQAPTAPPVSSRSKDAHGVLTMFGTKAYRRPLITVMLIMVAQQISGINAVMYYSTDILSRITPTSAAWISLMVTVVNALMTFPAMALIERLGRRLLLVGSAVGIVVSLVLAGLGIDYGYTGVASLAILGFVASFAVGMGPVPYVVISDVAPNRTIGALSTIGLSLNWATNFVVALVFLPLRNALSQGNDRLEGRVFYVFAAAFTVTFLLFLRMYR